jgi:competence protein ComEC
MSKTTLVFLSILFILLSLRLFTFYSSKQSYKDGQSIEFTSRVLSEPKVYKDYQSFSVEISSGERVFIKTEVYPIYYFQDNIYISGKLNYRLLGNKTRILALDFPKISFVKNSDNIFLAVVKTVRQKIITSFSTTLPKDLAGLMLGIVFGIKVDLSKNFLDSLRQTGVMHVIAASGMNVTMTGAFIFYLFSSFLKRQFAIILSVLGILFYAFLAGFEPSIIRASIMGIIAFSAQILGRQKDSFYALLLTAFLMLFVSPKFIFDIGFQLSFLSTLGILFIPQIFTGYKNFATEDLLTTLSAQIATLPILLSGFGSYSVLSILVNVLVLWTIPFLMILGAISALISFVFEPLGRLFLYLCLPFLLYFEKIVLFFTSFKLNLTVETISWQFILSYYLFLASFIVYNLKKHNE